MVKKKTGLNGPETRKKETLSQLRAVQARVGLVLADDPVGVLTLCTCGCDEHAKACPSPRCGCDRGDKPTNVLREWLAGRGMSIFSPTLCQENCGECGVCPVYKYCPTEVSFVSKTRGKSTRPLCGDRHKHEDACYPHKLWKTAEQANALNSLEARVTAPVRRCLFSVGKPVAVVGRAERAFKTLTGGTSDEARWANAGGSPVLYDLAGHASYSPGDKRLKSDFGRQLVVRTKSRALYNTEDPSICALAERHGPFCLGHCSRALPDSGQYKTRFTGHLRTMAKTRHPRTPSVIAEQRAKVVLEGYKHIKTAGRVVNPSPKRKRKARVYAPPGAPPEPRFFTGGAGEHRKPGPSQFVPPTRGVDA